MKLFIFLIFPFLVHALEPEQNLNPNHNRAAIGAHQEPARTAPPAIDFSENLQRINLAGTTFTGPLVCYSQNLNTVLLRNTDATAVVTASPHDLRVCNTNAPLDSVHISANASLTYTIFINADSIQCQEDLMRIMVMGNHRVQFRSRSNPDDLNLDVSPFLRDLGFTSMTTVTRAFNELYPEDDLYKIVNLKDSSGERASRDQRRQVAEVFENARQWGIDTVTQKLEEMEAWGPLLDENDTPLLDAVKRAKAFKALYISDAPRQKSTCIIS